MANCIGHFWSRNCLLKQVIEGKIKETMEGPGRQRRRHKQLLEIKRSHSLENSLWKKVWTSHKTDCVMMNKNAATDYITEICCLFQQVLFFSLIKIWL
jgi:hypothetical protein